MRCAACKLGRAEICDLCFKCLEIQHELGGRWDAATLHRVRRERVERASRSVLSAAACAAFAVFLGVTLVARPWRRW